MSSILDALKKLEAEKAARKAQEDQREEPFDPSRAADDLFGAPAAPAGQGFAVPETGSGAGLPKMALFLGGSLMLLMFGIVIGLAVWLTFAVTQLLPTQQEAANQATGTTQTASQNTDGEDITVTEAASSDAPPEPSAPDTTPASEEPQPTRADTPESPDPISETVAPAADPVVAEQPAPAPEDATPPAPEPPPAPAPASIAQQGPEQTQRLLTPPPANTSQQELPEPPAPSTPEREVVASRQDPVPEPPAATTPPPAPRETRPSPTVVTTERPTPSPATQQDDSALRATTSSASSPEPATRRSNEPVPDNLRSLPLLRNTERNTHGLEGMRINMLREPSDNRPNALAIINLNRVYVGERIPDTDARLIGVEARGIAIEIIGSNERYFVEH